VQFQFDTVDALVSDLALTNSHQQKFLSECVLLQIMARRRRGEGQVDSSAHAPSVPCFADCLVYQQLAGSDRICSCWGCWKTDTGKSQSSTGLPRLQLVESSAVLLPSINHGKSTGRAISPNRLLHSLIHQYLGHGKSQTGAGSFALQQSGLRREGETSLPVAAFLH